MVADSQLGLPPVRQQRIDRRPDPANKESDVTWRHKKWLAEFAERRGAIQGTMEQRVAEQAERAKRFAARSQAMRDAIRGIKAGTDTDRGQKAAAIEAALNLTQRPKYVPTEYVDVSQQYPTGAPQYRERQEEPQQPYASPAASAPSAAAAAAPSAAAPAQPSTSRKSAPAKKNLSEAKPGWARTAAEDDDFLDAEADALLDFASNLDYQEYIDDLEVREAIRFVQQRVQGMEQGKQNEEAMAAERAKMIAAGELEEVWVLDESLPPDADGKPAMRLIVRRPRRTKQALTMAEHESAWQGANGAGAVEQSERDRAAQADALTRTVLDSNRQLRNIHSSASVRAIMEKEGNNPTRPAANAPGGAATLRRAQLAAIPDEPPQPVITTIHERDGSEKKLNPSNLPFLYRHPGI